MSVYNFQLIKPSYDSHKPPSQMHNIRPSYSQFVIHGCRFGINACRTLPSLIIYNLSGNYYRQTCVYLRLISPGGKDTSANNSYHGLAYSIFIEEKTVLPLYRPYMELAHSNKYQHQVCSSQRLLFSIIDDVLREDFLMFKPLY